MLVDDDDDACQYERAVGVYRFAQCSSSLRMEWRASIALWIDSEQLPLFFNHQSISHLPSIELACFN